MTDLEQLVQRRAHELGISLRTLAERIDISGGSLSSLLKGRYRLTSPVALRIAAELKLDARQPMAVAPVIRLHGVPPR